MHDHDIPRPPLPGQVGTVPDMSGHWVTVTEAAEICAGQGLHRDIKTVRRWAQRSHARPENAEVLVHEQDTPTGFRYLIEASSLERKIAQELAFEASRAEADRDGQVLPGPGMPADPPVDETANMQDRTAPDRSTPVLPRPEMPDQPVEEEVRRLTVSSVTDDFLKDQIAEKDGQISQLNAQIERRDRQIDAMLERDKETNILINTLQETLSQVMGLESPARMRLRARDEGDSATGTTAGDAV